MVNSKKLFNISLLRLLATLIIFSFHIMLATSTEIAKGYFPFYFAVPIFLFISGYLYANKDITNIKKFYKNSLLKILKPTILFLVIYLLIVSIYSLINQINFFSLIINVNEFGQSYSPIAIGHLWFIIAIILCYLITPIIQKIYKSEKLSKNKKRLLYLLICILDIISLSFASLIFLPYLIGFLFSKNKNKINNNKVCLILIFIIFILCIPLYFWVYKLNINNYLSLILKYIKELFVVIFGVNFSILFLKIFENIKTTEFFNKILNLSDKYSFLFYICHHVLIFGIFNIFNITKIYWVNILIIFISTILLAFILNIFVKLLNIKTK